MRERHIWKFGNVAPLLGLAHEKLVVPTTGSADTMRLLTLRAQMAGLSGSGTSIKDANVVFAREFSKQQLWRFPNLQAMLGRLMSSADVCGQVQKLLQKLHPTHKGDLLAGMALVEATIAKYYDGTAR